MSNAKDTPYRGQPASLVLGVDIGGTFTDVAVWDPRGRRLLVGKALTTPDDPTQGVLDAVAQVTTEHGVQTADLGRVIHGTTLIANLLIERKGAVTALVTTRGFRDVLEIARERRYDMYDIELENARPLVPRWLRLEVTERLDAQGRVVTPLDLADAQRVARELRGLDVGAVAVVFLHSFRNPDHERAMGQVLREVLGADVSLSLSVEVAPEIREYERTATVVANAYAQPAVQRYLLGLLGRLQEQGFGGELHVMLSSGGTTTPETAARFPIKVVESGPAGGAVAASFFSRLHNLNKTISFDMGGTTAKSCLIANGMPQTTTDFEVARVYRFKKGSGIPLRTPVIDMIEIGAGGGSIARIDEMGLLQVGPASAGARPGPVCYDLGGHDPTVTDADLILGYLNPDYFLGGKMRLNRDRAAAAMQRAIAGPLGLSLAEAAHGIYEVVSENMANATLLHATEKGQDPSEYAMVAYGGAGPVHAHRVAQKLGVHTVLYPFIAGVGSAVGFLMAPIAFDFVRSYVARLADLDLAAANRMFADMTDQARQLLQRAGVAAADITWSRSCDMRYVGQGYEVEVPLPSGDFAPADRQVLESAFAVAYKQLFRRTNPGHAVETMNWRLVARGPAPDFALEPAEGAGAGGARKGSRPAFFDGEFRPCPVFDRYALQGGQVLAGPAIIEERESTVVVGPDAEIAVDRFRNLLVTLRRARAPSRFRQVSV